MLIMLLLVAYTKFKYLVQLACVCTVTAAAQDSAPTAATML